MPLFQAFPAKNRKTALQKGRLFFYQSLFLDMVRAVGLEPTRLTTTEPKSVQSTDSSMPAYSFVPLFLHGEAPEVERFA